VALIKRKLKVEFGKGNINTADELTTKARQMKAQSHRKPQIPPDLIDVMRAWTERARRWTGQVNEVKPYMDYFDTEPVVAQCWRELEATRDPRQCG
jgi:hypothetical protein